MLIRTNWGPGKRPGGASGSDCKRPGGASGSECKRPGGASGSDCKRPGGASGSDLHSEDEVGRFDVPHCDDGHVVVVLEDLNDVVRTQGVVRAERIGLEADAFLRQRPRLADDPDVWATLLHRQRARRALDDVHEVDVPVANLPHRPGRGRRGWTDERAETARAGMK